MPRRFIFMIPALLTALLFSFSAIFGQRAAKLFGPLRANALRLLIACVVLGILTAVVDAVRGQPSCFPGVFPALFLSGMVGFGLGDVGLFLAYSRLGARLTILINFSVGTLCAAWGDQLLLGISLTGGQWGGVGLVLAGLGLALWPVSVAGQRVRLPWSGLACAAVAGLGQGFGTTLTGWANQLAGSRQVVVHGISQAFQRSTAGVLVAMLVWGGWWFFQGKKRVAARPVGSKSPHRKHAGFWLAGAALSGPVAGVSCYQWARLELPSAVVVAVAATSTLWVIPLARWIEKDRPALRQTAGTFVAVGGIALLYLVRRPGG
jgi:drug/metabolite transporter (DMT)-like permease